MKIWRAYFITSELHDQIIKKIIKKVKGIKFEAGTIHAHQLTVQHHNGPLSY